MYDGQIEPEVRLHVVSRRAKAIGVNGPKNGLGKCIGDVASPLAASGRRALPAGVVRSLGYDLEPWPPAFSGIAEGQHSQPHSISPPCVDWRS
jgi:hypothetical protein